MYSKELGLFIEAVLSLYNVNIMHMQYIKMLNKSNYSALFINFVQ